MRQLKGYINNNIGRAGVMATLAGKTHRGGLNKISTLRNVVMLLFRFSDYSGFSSDVPAYYLSVKAQIILSKTE
jgi:hypothetical protein